MIELPFRLESYNNDGKSVTDQITVDCQINGTPFAAWVDTGAAYDLVLPYELAKQLNWITGNEPNLDPRPNSRMICKVNSEIIITVAEKEFALDSVFACDLSSAPVEVPIIGLKFLLKFRPEFDFRDLRIRLHQINSKPAFPYAKAQLINVVPVRTDQQLLIRAKIENIFGWFLWDTGAEIPTLLGPSLDALQTEWSRKVRWKAEILASMDGTASRFTEEFRVPKLSLFGLNERADSSEIKFRNLKFSGLDFPASQAALEAATGFPLLGLMNMDLMGAQRLLFDPDQSCLWRIGKRHFD